MSLQKLTPPLLIIALLVGLFFLLSQKPASYENEESASGELSVTPSMDNLKIEDMQIGTGAEVKSGDNIFIHYLGTLEDGTKFDSSYDREEPFETQIGVGQLIKGWDMGIPGMKVGGKRRLTIPPELGYGDRGAGNVIPPNATLIFEVELIDIID